MSDAPKPRIKHKGLAEALGVTEHDLEQMSLKDMAVAAYNKGGELDFRIAPTGITPSVELGTEKTSHD